MCGRMPMRRDWVALGYCRVCGTRRRHYDTVCDGCAIDARLRSRRRIGGVAWKAGRGGRAPRIPD